MNKDIIKAFNFSLEGSDLVGKIVKYSDDYKKSLGMEKFSRMHGAIAIDCTYKIECTQSDYKGDLCVRGYSQAFNDQFGRVLEINQVELV